MTAAHASAAVPYRVTRTIPVDFRPSAVAVDPTTRTVYVTNYVGDTVSVINEVTSTVIDNIEVGYSPDAV
ncbi:MAG: hypothetical protein ABSF03_18200, partial [Streptosporangiaceae bacterium]